MSDETMRLSDKNAAIIAENWQGGLFDAGGKGRVEMSFAALDAILNAVRAEALSTPSTRDEVGPVAGEVVAWYRMAERQPEPGFKFVALYEDGSGAWLGFQHDGGVIDADGDEYAQIPAAQWWAYLPSGFEFTCEDYAEDPVSLPAHVCPPLYAAPPPPQDDALRIAAVVAKNMADNASFNINQTGVTPETSSFERAFTDIYRTLDDALKSTAAQEWGAK